MGEVGVGEQGGETIYSSEQVKKAKGNRRTNTLLGNRDHKKTNFDFLGEQGNKQRMCNGFVLQCAYFYSKIN